MGGPGRHGNRPTDSLSRRYTRRNFYTLHSLHCDALKLLTPNCAFVGVAEVLLIQ
jgi:hypothetical protein